MTNIFFTADTHFGHANIIKYLDRPFSSISDMDYSIIYNWNDNIDKDDTIYHLGDFAWRNIENYRNHLNGKIHLILGNHDRLKRHEFKLFESVSPYKEIRVGKQTIVLMHYAMRVWNKSHFGSWHLFGHSHGTLPQPENYLGMDVGVDCWDFRPISFDDVKHELSKIPFIPVSKNQPNEEAVVKDILNDWKNR